MTTSAIIRRNPIYPEIFLTDGQRVSTVIRNFDAIGRWRDLGDSGGAIDATGELPGGVTGTEINRYGSSLGLMTRTDNAPAEVTPDEADIESSRRFGERVAALTAQFVKGGK